MYLWQQFVVQGTVRPSLWWAKINENMYPWQQFVMQDTMGPSSWQAKNLVKRNGRLIQKLYSCGFRHMWSRRCWDPKYKCLHIEKWENGENDTMCSINRCRCYAACDYDVCCAVTCPSNSIFDVHESEWWRMKMTMMTASLAGGWW